MSQSHLATLFRSSTTYKALKNRFSLCDSKFTLSAVWNL